MSAHQVLPLVVGALHALLALAALLRGAGQRTQQLFAALAGVLALWSFGIFQVRRGPDEAAGLAAQRLLNIAVCLTPAFYYHLVRVVTGTAAAHRIRVRVVYAVSAGFLLIALVAFPLLVAGVVRTPRGWAAMTAPLGQLLFVFYLAVLAVTLRPLLVAKRTPLVVASLVMLAAPLTNFVGAILLRLELITRELPPFLLPASVVFIALVWFATRERES